MSSSAAIPYGESAAAHPSRAFPAFAWTVLIYNLAVILWGALVRATGSGAGCGGHWPLCNGDVLPASPQTATLIEFTHRVMSGIALATAAILAGWGWRAFPPKHPVRRWASLSLVFMLTEALIGAALVLLGHVAQNESVGRVYSLSAHLINTFLLLASLALTAWWSTEPAARLMARRFASGSDVEKQNGLLAAGVIALTLVAMAGVITALGDTLFPAHSLAQGIADDFAATANFLIRLRVIHPALAIAAAMFLAWLAMRQIRGAPCGSLRRLAIVLVTLLGAQIAMGTVTVLLRAPIPMQLAHLLVADCLWITFVLFASEYRHSRPDRDPARTR